MGMEKKSFLEMTVKKTKTMMKMKCLTIQIGTKRLSLNDSKRLEIPTTRYKQINENWARLLVKVKLKMAVQRPMVLQRQNEVLFRAFVDAKMDARPRDVLV